MIIPDEHLPAIKFALKYVRDEWRSICMQYTGVEAQAIADANEEALAALAAHAQPQAAGGVVWTPERVWALEYVIGCAGNYLSEYGGDGSSIEIMQHLLAELLKRQRPQAQN